MTKIPNNVIRPPKGYEYVTVEKKIPIVQIKRITDIANGDKLTSQDDIKKRIDYLESKIDKLMDELRVLKRRDKYKPKPEERAKRVWMSDILEAVCDYFEVSPTDIQSERRHADLVRVRSVFINLCHALTYGSYSAIGRMCGNRDHTTIIHHSRLKRNKTGPWNIKKESGIELWSDFGKLEAKLKAEAQPDNE